MKTRIVHTKIWKDEYFCSLSRAEKLAFLYVLTNENANLLGIYELNDMEIKLWCGFTDVELTDIKNKFTRDGKIIFYKGWVKIVNHDRYNSKYLSGSNVVARERELTLISQDILQELDHRSTIGQRMVDHTINHKSEIINHKSEIRNKKSERENGISQIESIDNPDIFTDIASKYGVPASFVESKYEDLVNYVQSTGKTYRDYLAALRNWVKRDAEKFRKEVYHATRQNRIAKYHAST